MRDGEICLTPLNSPDIDGLVFLMDNMICLQMKIAKSKERPMRPNVFFSFGSIIFSIWTSSHYPMSASFSMNGVMSMILREKYGSDEMLKTWIKSSDLQEAIKVSSIPDEQLEEIADEVGPRIYNFIAHGYT